MVRPDKFFKLKEKNRFDSRYQLHYLSPLQVFFHYCPECDKSHKHCYFRVKLLIYRFIQLLVAIQSTGLVLVEGYYINSINRSPGLSLWAHMDINPRGLCNLGYPHESHLKAKSRLLIYHFPITQSFEILHRARQYYCRALRKISDDWTN